MINLREGMVLTNLLRSASYARTVLPHLKAEYFENDDTRKVYQYIDEHFTKYNNIPNKHSLLITLESDTTANEQLAEKVAEVVNKLDHDRVVEQPPDEKFLLDTTETWCKDRACFVALSKSVSIARSDPAGTAKIVDLMREAIAVSFDPHIGHDYIADAELRLKNYQEKLDRIPTGVDILDQISLGGPPRKTLNVFLAKTNMGKALTNRTVIPTPSGPKIFGELVVGDKVYGSDGWATTVTGVFPQGIRRVYRVLFVDGREVECDGEHLWSVFTHDKDRINEVLTTKTIEERIKEKKRISVPLCGPVSTPFRKSVSYQNATTVHAMLRFSVCSDMPREVVEGTENQRINYAKELATAMHLDKWENCYSTSVSSRDYAWGIAQLFWGIGYRARITDTTYGWRIAVPCEDIDCLQKGIASTQGLEIVDVIETDVDVQCTCITVDAADHLFLANNYVVTHNTMLMSCIAGNMMMQGYNVLYLTGEDGEHKIGKRIDANLLDTHINALDEISTVEYNFKIAALKKRVGLGQLIIKEFQPHKLNAVQGRALFDELVLKKNFRADAVFLDYLNICGSSLIKMSQTNSYGLVKAVAEEWRGFAQETNTVLFTATQVNRSGIKKDDVEMDDISDSFGVPMTADWMFSGQTNAELAKMNLWAMMHLKSRYDSTDVTPKFFLQVDKTKQRVTSVDSALASVGEHYATRDETYDPFKPASR